MTRWLCVVLAVGVLATAGAAAAATEDDDFAASKRENTTEAWERFVARHPKGKLVAAAREAHDLLVHNEAQGARSDPTRLEQLFRRCKSPRYADKLFALWDTATWQAAREAGSIKQCRRYLLRFPGGAHVKQANAAMEEMEWQAAQKADTKDAYDTFLAKHRGGKRAADARKAIQRFQAAAEEQAWKQCRAAGTREAYEQFLQKHRSGKHARDARDALTGLDFEEARKTDTIKAYQQFLKKHYSHKAAQKRLRQLMYDKAVASERLEDWLAFDAKYGSRSWSNDGPIVKQMKKNAQDEIERLMYAKIIAEPTLKLCEDYLRRFRERRFGGRRFGEGPHRRQVLVKMEPCLFEWAAKTNTADAYLKYLRTYTEGYRDSEIRARLDKLVLRKLAPKEDFSAFTNYLRLYPKRNALLIARMEPHLFEWAKAVNTLEACERYLGYYPKEAHSQEVRALLDPLVYKKAKEEDWHNWYEKYLKECPNGKHVKEAKARLDFLKANRAVVVAEFPKVVYSSSRWSWVTVFKETGGKVGFRVSGSGWVVDKKGDRYGPSGGSISRGQPVKVPPGGSGSDSYWCRGPAFVDGHASFTWTGEDAGGHRISIREVVQLRSAKK